MWKPSTVEDIRAWMAGTYVVNPTAKEQERAMFARWRELARKRQ